MEDRQSCDSDECRFQSRACGEIKGYSPDEQFPKVLHIYSAGKKQNLS